ncbi:Ribokinase-like protein [Apiospora sp. TS-2023a]
MSYSIPHFVAEGENLPASSVARRRGGNCPNTIDVLQQLIEGRDEVADLQAHLVAVVPSLFTPASTHVETSLGGFFEGEVFALSHCIFRDGQIEPASRHIIQNLATSSRTVISHNPLQEMTVAEFKEIPNTLGTDAIWYHFEVWEDCAIFLLPIG